MRKLRSGRRFGHTGTIAALGIAAVIILVAAGTGSAHSARVIRFTGQAGKTLPQFRVTAPSTMFWTNSGSFFLITSNGGYCGDGSVGSEAHRGMTYLPPGRYDALRVAAIGNWTITIRSGVERLGTPITFRGSGGRALPPFRIPNGKTMYWTNTGSRFQTFSANSTTVATVNSAYPANSGTVATVSSAYHRGKMRLPAGRYRLFVDASAPDEPMGSWRIVIR